MGNNSRKKRMRRLEKQDGNEAPLQSEAASMGWSGSDKLAIALFCLAAVMAIVLYWIDKTSTTAGISIAIIALFMIYPILHFVHKPRFRIISFGLVAILIAGFGWKIWPVRATVVAEQPPTSGYSVPQPQVLPKSVAASPEKPKLPISLNPKKPRPSAAKGNPKGATVYGVFVKGANPPSAPVDPCSLGNIDVDGFKSKNLTEAVHTEGKTPCIKIKNLDADGGGQGIHTQEKPSETNPPAGTTPQ